MSRRQVVLTTLESYIESSEDSMARVGYTLTNPTASEQEGVVTVTVVISGPYGSKVLTGETSSLWANMSDKVIAFIQGMALVNK